MAHFAKLGIGNKVIKVEVVHDDVATTEEAGVEFLRTLHNDLYGIYKQYSPRTKGGVNSSGGEPFRKNAASIGMTYDEARDAFIPKQPYPDWTLNEDTCLWEAPVAYPDDGEIYEWNSTTGSWDQVGGS
tara:strand:- start:48 stop:434 length:387 start_codon:yes stop_codon:yes gene_type:complete